MDVLQLHMTLCCRYHSPFLSRVIQLAGQNDPGALLTAAVLRLDVLCRSRGGECGLYRLTLVLRPTTDPGLRRRAWHHKRRLRLQTRRLWRTVPQAHAKTPQSALLALGLHQSSLNVDCDRAGPVQTHRCFCVEAQRKKDIRRVEVVAWIPAISDVDIRSGFRTLYRKDISRLGIEGSRRSDVKQV